MSHRDDYDYWRDQIAGTNKVEQSKDEDGCWLPECGFWRYEASGDAIPVAVWRDESGLVGKVGDKNPSRADFMWCERVFSRCRAVTEEAYRAALNTGVWPDNATAGHNKAPEGLAEIEAAIDALVVEADRLVKKGPAKTQEEADEASNLSSRLRALYDRVDKMRLDEKRPILAEAKRVDDRMTPVRDRAGTRAGQIDTHVLKPFLSEQRRLVREAAAKVKAETGVDVLPRARGGGEAAISVNAGTKGAKKFLATVWNAEIEDYDKALNAVKDSPVVKTAVQSVCDAAARSKNKVPIPGVKFVSTDDVRG